MTAILQRVCDLLALVAVVAIWCVAVRAYPRLPLRVPTHFGFSGRPDAWGRKETIFLLPAVSLGIYLLQWRVMRLVGHEVPSTSFTLVLSLLRLETAALMLAIEQGMIAVARGRAARLGNAIWVYTAAILATSFLLTAVAPPKGGRRHAEGRPGPRFYAWQPAQSLPVADFGRQAARPVLHAG
jgi:hypothetical protein